MIDPVRIILRITGGKKWQGDPEPIRNFWLAVTVLLWLAMLAAVIVTHADVKADAGETSTEWHERDWQRHLAAKLGAEEEHRLPDGSRVDLLTDETAFEIDWSYKWQESIGQALFYATSTDRDPGVVLLLKGDKAEEDYLEFLTVVAVLRQHFSFRVLVVDTRRAIQPEIDR